MSKVIRTLSLAGYIKGKQNDGYAVALIAPEESAVSDVIQEYAEAEYYPQDTRVNVATGEITQPTKLRGYYLKIHSGHLCEGKNSQYVARSIPEFNTFIRSLK